MSKKTELLNALDSASPAEIKDFLGKAKAKLSELNKLETHKAASSKKVKAFVKKLLDAEIPEVPKKEVVEFSVPVKVTLAVHQEEGELLKDMVLGDMDSFGFTTSSGADFLDNYLVSANVGKIEGLPPAARGHVKAAVEKFFEEACDQVLDFFPVTVKAAEKADKFIDKILDSEPAELEKLALISRVAILRTAFEEAEKDV